MLLEYNTGKDGKTAVTLRMTKNRKRKYIRTGLKATSEEWDTEQERFVSDRKLVPNFKQYNCKLSALETRINLVIRDFETTNTDWTLNQFEDAFLNRSSKGHVKEFILRHVSMLKDTGHIGNSICYSRVLHMLELFDGKFAKKVFSEIDLKYVKAFDVFLQKRDCKGNTRKYYFKVLRSILNLAIQEKEASESTYPFGKGGFNIAALEEETEKRYLPHTDMDKIKNTVMSKTTLEMTRRLFLFSYYCYGISFIDAALLTKKNIIRYNSGHYIVYKRNKTKEAKKVKPIQIKITNEIQDHLDWFAANTPLVEDYLLPYVSVAGYKGEQLYKHIRNRFGLNNKNLRTLAQELEITDMKLTSYVSRHTMAMTLQDNQVPREVISQILGHSDLATTNTYLDSFANNVIDEAVKVL
jgi:integrase